MTHATELRPSALRPDAYPRNSDLRSTINYVAHFIASNTAPSFAIHFYTAQCAECAGLHLENIGYPNTIDISPDTQVSTDGELATPRSSRGVLQLTSGRQDFELAAWQMTYLCVSPRRVWVILYVDIFRSLTIPLGIGTCIIIK